MALRRDLRFGSRREIRRLIERGQRRNTPLGRVFTLPAPAGRGRILFVISSRVSKKSTVRHRLKRILDAWASDRFASGKRPGLDVLLFLNPPAVGFKPADLRALADRVFRRLLPQH